MNLSVAVSEYRAAQAAVEDARLPSSATKSVCALRVRP
jgi:hypothetical protein